MWASHREKRTASQWELEGRQYFVAAADEKHSQETHPREDVILWKV
jgi:hypothetical protein